jgi:hypothetical protein
VIDRCAIVGDWPPNATNAYLSRDFPKSHCAPEPRDLEQVRQMLTVINIVEKPVVFRIDVHARDEEVIRCAHHSSLVDGYLNSPVFDLYMIVPP